MVLNAIFYVAVVVKRCETTDMEICQANPKHPCCGQYKINRFFPVGPYVQPTLMENWVSSLFEFSGQNPVAFTWIKTATIFTIVAISIIFWGLLGAHLGVIDTKAELLSRSDNLLDNVVFDNLEKGDDWMGKLQDYADKHPSFKKNYLSKFVCCVTDSNLLKCAATKANKKANEKKKKVTMLGCLTELMYEVDVDKRTVRNH